MRQYGWNSRVCVRRLGRKRWPVVFGIINLRRLSFVLSFLFSGSGLAPLFFPVIVKAVLQVTDQRTRDRQRHVMMLEEGARREIAAPGPGNLSIDEDQLAMVETGEGITDANDLDKRLAC